MIIRHARPFRLFPRSLLALCWLIPGRLRRHVRPEGAGRLISQVPTRVMHPRPMRRNGSSPSTWLADGTAIFTTLYIGKNDVIQHGRWTQKRQPNRSYV